MPTTTTGTAPFSLTSSSRTRTVGVPVTTGTAPFALASSSSEALTLTPGPWTADVSQAATIMFEAVPGVAIFEPVLAVAPAHLTVVELPIASDTIDPLTVDSDGRVHSDGT